MLNLDPLDDETSSVYLIDHMGDDLSVVNAARVSFSKVSDKLTAGDKRLIKYLAEHKHWTPFSHPQFQFRIKMPLFVAREWFRHTVGFTRNEVSRRYVDDPPEFYVPTTIRGKPIDGKKQGSSGVHEQTEFFKSRMSTLTYNAAGSYIAMIDQGVAPEMARMILPQNMYTEFIETGSLAAYARLAGLRLSPDAQTETRKYAEAISEFVQVYCPESWSALIG